MQRILGMALVAVLVGLTLTAHAAEGSRAEELYHRALASGVEPLERVRLLKESLAAAPSYAAAFELGRIYDALAEPVPAIAAFEQAATLSPEPAQQAGALSIAARIYRATGDLQAASATLRLVRRIRPSPEAERELREIERSHETVSAAAITKRLQHGLAKRSLGLQPTIDLRVSFDLDSATLTPAGRGQVQELGRALADSALAPYRVRLVGHTDKRGSDHHNDRLSLQRAEAVKTCLVAACGIGPERIIVEGKGRREPLFRGESEEEYALNRRVAVVLEE